MELVNILEQFTPVIAIAISFISLGVSVATALFNRRVKIVEMRSTFLSKSLELESRLSSISNLQHELTYILEAQGNMATWDLERVAKIRDRFTSTREILSIAPRSNFVALYEKSYHAIQNLCLEAEEIEQQIQTEISHQKARGAA